MGVDTAEELVRQGEQLNNVERKVDDIDGDLKTSQKHLNNIKSIFGGIKNWWTGKKEVKEEQQRATGQAESERLQAALERDRIENPGRNSAGQHPALQLRSDDGQGFYSDNNVDARFASSGGAGATSSAYSNSYSRQSQPKGSKNHQIDSNLDEMSAGMSRLKGLALGMGDEITKAE